MSQGWLDSNNSSERFLLQTSGTRIANDRNKRVISFPSSAPIATWRHSLTPDLGSTNIAEILLGCTSKECLSARVSYS